ncbi:hypothetical protein Tco_0926595 [Tanacetum coccineum]|uniref:Uncharacterized protein n=1 Tax=Tanacetum coccineum TaxID=301880 RepID=A0ABQ5DA86_9ASTR
MHSRQVTMKDLKGKDKIQRQRKDQDQDHKSMNGTKELSQLLHDKDSRSRQEASKIKDQEHMIVAGADNRPPMLEKSMYTSWASRMLLYIKVDGVTRLKTYGELSDKEKIQDDCDLRATNIVLHGLPPDIYALVNHNQVAKQI